MGEVTGYVDRVHCGDCLDLLRELPENSVDLCLTDPPYELSNSRVPIRGRGVAARRNESHAVADPWGASLGWVDAVGRLRPRHWVVFASYKMLGRLCCAIEQYATIGALFTWRKPNAPRMARPVPRLDTEFVIWARSEDATCLSMGEFSTTVIDAPFPQAGCMASERILRPGTKCAAHPCQKPLVVVRPFVERACQPSGVILDPFLGSGTTAVACVETGRHFIGIEREPEYVAIAEARIAAALRAHQPTLALEAAE